MSSAREFVLTDVAAIREAAQNAALIPTTGMHGDEQVARVLRNGLAVIALAALERFLRERVAELAVVLTARAHLKFNELPEALQNRLAVSALAALSSELGRSSAPLAKIGDVVSLGKSLASLDSARTAFSASSLQWAGSNVRPDDIEQALRALGYKNPWGQLSEVMSKAIRPGTKADVSAVLRGLLDRRHSAAHDAAHTVSVLEVRSLHRDVLILALTVDALLSDAARCLIEGDLNSATDVSRIAVWSVEKPLRATRYRLRSESKRPSTFATFDDAARNSVARETKAKRGALVLLRDGADDIIDWRLTVDF